MNVAVVEGMAEPNLPVDEETLYMNESHLIPIPIQRGVYFYCDTNGYVHAFCNIDINNEDKVAVGCWFGPQHCL